MKNKLLLLIIVLCYLLNLVSCSNSKKEDFSKDQANAYFLVFQNLYELDTGLNGGKYIAVDLSKIKLSDKKSLIALIKNFCDNNKCTLLLDTFEGLKEKGYIKGLLFKDGILISFEDKMLNRNSLITSAKKWRSGTGAIGSDYTVEKKNDSWKITKIANSWIS